MKGMWLDRGNDLDPVKAKAHGIVEPIFDIRDATRERLVHWRDQGYKPGVYACWNWPEVHGLSGAGFAEWTSAKLAPLTKPGETTFPSVHLNDETHHPARIVAMLQRWRKLRSKRKTLWTLEGQQGGLFDSQSVAAIVKANVNIGPQCYTGDMTRMESAPVLLDLLAHGFPASRIKCFYDAGQLGYWWDGVAYTQGRLP